MRFNRVFNREGVVPFRSRQDDRRPHRTQTIQAVPPHPKVPPALQAGPQPVVWASDLPWQKSHGKTVIAATTPSKPEALDLHFREEAKSCRSTEEIKGLAFVHTF